MDECLTKRCWKCKFDKPTTAFARQSARGDGLCPLCRECSSADSRERRERRKKRLPYEIPTPSTKLCHKCGHILAAFMFGTDPGSSDGLRVYCKDCNAASSLDSYHASKKLLESRQQFDCKTCTRCGTERPSIEFREDARSQDGRGSHCKDCRREYHKNYLHRMKARSDDEIAKAIPSFKRCYSCQEVLPSAAYARTRMRKDGLQIRCRLCNAIHSRGISVAYFRQLLEQQNNSCAICNIAFRLSMEDYSEYGQTQNIYIDHNHATGVVRGLLCPRCNSGIGLLGDSPLTLAKAAKYVANNGIEVSHF